MLLGRGDVPRIPRLPRRGVIDPCKVNVTEPHKMLNTMRPFRRVWFSQCWQLDCNGDVALCESSNQGRPICVAGILDPLAVEQEYIDMSRRVAPGCGRCE